MKSRVYSRIMALSLISTATTGTHKPVALERVWEISCRFGSTRSVCHAEGKGSNPVRSTILISKHFCLFRLKYFDISRGNYMSFLKKNLIEACSPHLHASFAPFAFKLLIAYKSTHISFTNIHLKDLQAINHSWHFEVFKE